MGTARRAQRSTSPRNTPSPTDTRSALGPKALGPKGSLTKEDTHDGLGLNLGSDRSAFKKTPAYARLRSTESSVFTMNEPSAASRIGRATIESGSFERRRTI